MPSDTAARANPRRRRGSERGHNTAHKPARQRSRHSCGDGDGSARRKAPLPTKADWTDLIKHMESRALLPAIVFVSSRRRCDLTAAALGHLDLTRDEQKQLIRRRLRDLETQLSGSDRCLESVSRSGSSR